MFLNLPRAELKTLLSNFKQIKSRKAFVRREPDKLREKSN